MSISHNCPCTHACPLQRAMEMIGGKWKLAILCSLSVDGTVRYNELLRKIKGISNTMLARSLQELEGDGLVRRSEYLEVPIRVEYEVTDKAKELTPILVQLAQWAVKNQAPTNE
ncbi:MAG: helix-turn-helix transcriptional regulator [Clostridia bacterium]|nr:helix-turn-helix transcriptional regulator [Clostridia bacterium]